MALRFALAAALIAITLTSQGADAALQSRLGGQAYYDDQLDITWAVDANINGGDTWDNQVGWVTNLFINGVAGWRLPNMDVNNDGTIVVCDSGAGQAACMDNEYAHLNRYGAGTTWGSGGIGSNNPSPFSDIGNALYWSSTQQAPVDAWSFAMVNGSQEHF